MSQPPSNKTVMIYDDDPDIRDICSIILQGKGFTIHCKSNCNDIVEHVREYKPVAVLMDNWLPDIGGVKAVQLLKLSEFKDVPVVFFTANTQAEELAKEAGAEFFLRKPFEIAELENVVGAAVDFYLRS